MNYQTIRIKPGELNAFARLSPQRFRRWVDAGLFGEAAIRPGTGAPRDYGIGDMVVAKIAATVLDAGRSKTLEVLPAEELLPALRKSIPQLVASVNGAAVWGVFYVDEQGERRMSLRIHGKLESEMPANGAVVVDIREIVQQAKAWLDSRTTSE